MWVYGDRIRRVRSADLLAEVEADLARGEWVSALIGLGQLAQGVADAEFAERGFDVRSPAVDGIMGALTEVALPSPSAKGKGLLGELAPSNWPEFIETRIPEGYAFYALLPALHAAAAAQLPPGDWRVIGIRSIGTSLSAVVAAVLEAPPPVTVRPVGHPFDRRLQLAPELEAEWAAHAGPFVIVDEGPGLSGSSFGAAADALERLGAARERIAFLPGHGGDLGPEASAEHRARWSAARRPTASFEDVVLPRLAAGVEALVGPAVEPMRDISGGSWRDLRAGPERPPVNAGGERRKFLYRTTDGDWLVKFAGLGRIGEAKLERTRALHGAGFTSEPAGLAEGFLVERWIGDAGLFKPDRATLLARLGDYLAFRAEALPAEPGDGADVATLLEMARTNAGEALGPAAAEAVSRLRSDIASLEGQVRRVRVDARLHAWEWLQLSGGRLLKTDALDHAEAHDLIGAQDIAWDVAGAEAEFDLSPIETKQLGARVGAHAGLVAFTRPAYLAFQLGLWTMAAEAQAGWPEEAGRTRARVDHYAGKLAAVLGVDPPGPRG